MSRSANGSSVRRAAARRAATTARRPACVVKVLVAATPISGPACVSSTASACSQICEPSTFVTATVGAPSSFARRIAASVSRVSPDWLMASTTSSASTAGSA